jgi:hypothetical protein
LLDRDGGQRRRRVTLLLDTHVTLLASVVSA